MAVANIAYLALSICPSFATILVGIPTVGGIVVATDSRSSLTNGIYCDSREKVFSVPDTKPALVFATAGIDVLIAPGDLSKYKNLCDALTRSPKVFDLNSAVKTVLSAYAPTHFSKDDFKIFQTELLRLINQKKDTSWDLPPPGSNLFDIRIFTHDPKTGARVLADFCAALSQQGVIVTKRAAWEEYLIADAPKLFVEYDPAFFDAHVAASVRKFIQSTGVHTVGELSVSKGMELVVLAIKETYRAVGAAQSGTTGTIGGPIRTYVVNESSLSVLK